MTEHIMRDQFMTLYDNCADDIFAYCYKKVAHRDVAKYLTRNIFMKTWDMVGQTRASIAHMKRMLFRTAKNHIKGFIDTKYHANAYSENIWNLTLSQ